MALKVLGVIPARAGSQRIPNKNMRLLAGWPLLEYSVAAARSSQICTEIAIATDGLDMQPIADRYGARVIPRAPVTGLQPDIVWVRDVLSACRAHPPDVLMILRPTSPFRDAAVIRAAWQRFEAEQPADSLRLVRRVREHPGKMWMAQRSQRLVPLLPYWTRTGQWSTDTPWHSAPTQSLPDIYMQTAGLEIAWVRSIRHSETIAGVAIVGYLVDGAQALDINTEEDWQEAERLIAAGVKLPDVV